jgi:hypothetical protein
MNELDCYARYMNDPRCEFCCNVRVGSVPIYYGVRNLSCVSYTCTALRDIPAGSELFISYGDDYWKAHQERWDMLSSDMQNNICSLDNVCFTH